MNNLYKQLASFDIVIGWPPSSQMVVNKTLWPSN